MGNLLNSSRSFLNRNSSTILTCIGAAGVVVTSVMAVKATPKALLLLENAEEEKGDDLTKLEKVKIAGPAYIPAVVTGIATIACVFGANALNKRQQAALMSAYAFLDSSYKDYRNKVEELYGEGADDAVRAEVAKDKYVEADIHDEDGKQLFYDDFSGRYFNSTMADVRRATYEINRKISLWGGAFVNEFYEALDIPQLEYGTQLGWSTGSLMSETWGNWLDFDITKTVIDDDLECYIVTMRTPPVADYEYY